MSRPSFRQIPKAATSALTDLIIARRTGTPDRTLPAEDRTALIDVLRSALVRWEAMDGLIRFLTERGVSAEARAGDDVVSAILNFQMDALSDRQLADLLLAPATALDLLDLIPLKGSAEWQALLEDAVPDGPDLAAVLQAAGLEPVDNAEDETVESMEVELAPPAGFGWRTTADAPTPGPWVVRGLVRLPEPVAARCYGNAAQEIQLLIERFAAIGAAITLRAAVRPAPTLDGFVLTVHLPGSQYAVMPVGRSEKKSVYSAESNRVSGDALPAEPIRLTIEVR